VIIHRYHNIVNGDMDLKHTRVHIHTFTHIQPFSINRCPKDIQVWATLLATWHSRDIWTCWINMWGRKKKPHIISQGKDVPLYKPAFHLCNTSQRAWGIT